VLGDLWLIVGDLWVKSWVVVRIVGLWDEILVDFENQNEFLLLWDEILGDFENGNEFLLLWD
jgi:hypothetical protein